MSSSQRFEQIIDDSQRERHIPASNGLAGQKVALHLQDTFSRTSSQLAPYKTLCDQI